MKQLVTETDSAKKRKLLKRQRSPTSIEDNSEEFAVPVAKRSCQRHRKETADACAKIHWGTSEEKVQYWMLCG